MRNSLIKVTIQYNNELTEFPLCLLLLYSLDDPLQYSGHHAGVQVPGHLAPDVPAQHIGHQPVDYGLNCQTLVYKNNNYNNDTKTILEAVYRFKVPKISRSSFVEEFF